MPQKKRKQSSSFVTVATLSVVLSALAVTAAMTNAEGTDGTVATYYAASAGYQPLNYLYQPGNYYPSQTSIQVSSSRRTVLPRAVLNRKIKALNRTITSVHKRLMLAEDRIDAQHRAIAMPRGDTPEALEKLAALELQQDKLENQLSKLEYQLADLTMQLSDAQ